MVKQNNISDSTTKTEILEERIKSQNILFAEKENQRISQFKLLESELIIEREKVDNILHDKRQLESKVQELIDENKVLVHEIDDVKAESQSEKVKQISNLEGSKRLSLFI